MRECPNCKTMLEDDELFCHECGTKQEIEENVAPNEEAAPLEKKCIHCGETIEEDSAFCPYCGESQTVEEVKEPEPEVEKEPASEEEPEPKQEENPAPEENAEPEETPVQEALEEHPHYDLEDEPKSKKWIWILLVVLLIGVIGGGYYYLHQVIKPTPRERGMLIAYYAKENIENENHGCKKGELYYDSNDCEVRFKENNDNYIFEEDVDDPDGVGIESWSVPKSKIEKKIYKMSQLSVEIVGSKAVFVSDKGCTARIFWSNINGHKYCSWDGKETYRSETNKYKECYVLSAELIDSEDGHKYLFEEQLTESQGFIKLYTEWEDYLVGKLGDTWMDAEGWDYKKSAYNADGQLLTDQWAIDGIADELSIAYLEEENALYINGDLYYRK